MSDTQTSPQEINRSDLVSELRAFPEELKRVVQGYSADALLKPASGGGWSVVEIVCHLLDWEEIFLQRVSDVLDSDQPELPAFDDSLWDIEHQYRSQDFRTVLSRFTDVRGQFANRLSTLDAAGWERTGMHQIHGPVTVEWLASQVRDHSRDHLSQIRDALC